VRRHLASPQPEGRRSDGRIDQRAEDQDGLPKAGEPAEAGPAHGATAATDRQGSCAYEQARWLMTTEQEREGNELTLLLQAAALYSHGARDEVRKPLLKLADKLLKKTDGQTRNELEIARANLAAAGK
jgi:hypothetical protein